MGVALNDDSLSVSGSQKTSYMGRILDLLELAVISSSGPLTLTEISQQAGVPLSTASRLLKQLEEWSFLTDDGNGRFLPGGRMTRMAVMVHAQLHTPTRLAAVTKMLSETTGESVTGGLVVGEKMIIVARTESEHPLRAVNRVGEHISPARAALGKAVMSRLPHARQLTLLRASGYDDPETQLTHLEQELLEAKQDGFAIDEETFAPGLRCRAAPIIGPDGSAIGGLSIGGPSARYTRAEAERTVPMLLEQARLLSSEIEPST